MEWHYWGNDRKINNYDVLGGEKVKLILDTNAFYHLAKIDEKNFVNNKFQDTISSSEGLGLSVLTVYEFLIRHATNFDIVKDKMIFIQNNISNFYGYPNMNAIFDNDMLNKIILMKRKSEFEAFVESVIVKRATIEVIKMYDFIRLILSRYEHSLFNFYRYEHQFDTSMLTDDMDFDFLSFAYSEPWLKIRTDLFLSFKTSFIKAAKDPLINTYKKISIHNNKGNLEKYCKNIFDYCLGKFAIDLHLEFVKFLHKSEIVIAKTISGEIDRHIQSISEKIKTNDGCMTIIAKQINEFGKITIKEAKIKGLKMNDGNHIKHSNYFADVGMESTITILNQSPIYIYYVIEKINSNISDQRKFRKNDIFDSGIINHVNNTECSNVLTLDENLIRTMESIYSRITNGDVSQRTVDNLSQSITVSKSINLHYN